MAQGIGDVTPAGAAKKADDQIAEGSECLRGIAPSDTTTILLKGDITHVMYPILNRPVTAP